MEPGWFGRLTTATGFAICHQLPERSLTFGDQTFFVCARCNGLYLGLALGLIYWIIRLWANGRFFPHNIRIGVLIAAGLPGIPYYLDIWTSYLGLRSTTNTVRFATGLFFGVSITAFSIFLLDRDLFRAGDANHELSVPGWLDVLLLDAIASMGFAFYVRMPYLFGALLTITGILALYSFVVFALIARLFPRTRAFTLALIALVSTPAALLGLALLKSAFFW